MAQRVYLDMGSAPRDVLRVMGKMWAEIERYQKSRARIWIVILVLFGAGVGFWIINHWVDEYANRGFLFLGILFFIGAGVLLLYALSSNIPAPGRQFEIAREIIHTLRDDVGSGGRVTGWLDLTGPQQHSKLLRTGHSSSGNIKYYYRDPWFSIKLQLVDGNLLRLTLFERIKVKKGYVAGRRSQIKAKLVVNSQVYEIGPGLSVEGLTQSDTDLVLEANTLGSIQAQEVLHSLKAMYTHLYPKKSLGE
jgi:hypothetical protein